MYNVAVLTPSFDDSNGCALTTGGGGVVAMSLINELKKIENINLTVYTISLNCSPCGIRVVTAPEEYAENGEKFVKFADGEIKKEHYDLIISANLYAPYFGNMLQCHSHEYRCRNAGGIVSIFKRFFSKRKIKAERRFFASADKNADYIAVSQIIKRDYQNNYGISPDKIIVAYPGSKIVYSQFVPPPKKTEPVFGIVANSSINKGGHIFLFAAGLLKLTGAKFKIKMIAPKFYKDYVMRLICAVFGLKSRLETLPKQKDMSAFYKDIDWLVLPSKNEAFALVVTEAASYCKPSVISGSAGVCEIMSDFSSIKYNRKSFVCFFNALKRACDMYMNNFEGYKHFAENAYNISKIYTPEKFVKSILEQKL